MPQATKLHNLTNTAVEALQLAFVECRQASAEGFILAALALVAELQDELKNTGLSGGCGKTCASC